MSKELEYHIDMQIRIEDKEQSDELIELLEANEDIISDYDPEYDEGRDMYWMVSVQFTNVLSLTSFTGKLVKKGYKL